MLGLRSNPVVRLRVGISTHFLATATTGQTDAAYPYYYEYLRPKTPAGRGWNVSPEQFAADTSRHGATMIGTTHQLIEKILDAHDALHLDRFIAQIDWGGLPKPLVDESINRYAAEIIPAVRSIIGP